MDTAELHTTSPRRRQAVRGGVMCVAHRAAAGRWTASATEGRKRNGAGLHMQYMAYGELEPGSPKVANASNLRKLCSGCVRRATKRRPVLITVVRVPRNDRELVRSGRGTVRCGRPLEPCRSLRPHRPLPAQQWIGMVLILRKSQPHSSYQRSPCAIVSLASGLSSRSAALSRA